MREDHGDGQTAAVDPGRARRGHRAGDARPAGSDGKLARRGDRLQGAVETGPAPQGRGIPEREGHRGIRLVQPAHARRLGTRAARDARLHRPLRGPRALRARRHRQDPSRGRVGQARVHARDTGRVLRRDRAAHAAAPREARGPARCGASADRQGESPGHRRVRLHADRRGGFQAPVPGHIGFLRDPERHPRHEHRVLRLGTRARRQEHGRRVDRPHRAPRQARQIRGRLIPQRARPHDQITKEKGAAGSDGAVPAGNQPPVLLKNSAHTVDANLQKHTRLRRLLWPRGRQRAQRSRRWRSA